MTKKISKNKERKIKKVHLIIEFECGHRNFFEMKNHKILFENFPFMDISQVFCDCKEYEHARD